MKKLNFSSNFNHINNTNNSNIILANNSIISPKNDFLSVENSTILPKNIDNTNSLLGGESLDLNKSMMDIDD
jgi:hypothetical protein